MIHLKIKSNITKISFCTFSRIEHSPTVYYSNFDRTNEQKRVYTFRVIILLLLLHFNVIILF